MTVLYYFFMIVTLLGVCVIGGYGVLILGGLINGGLRKARNWHWIIYCVGILGLVLLFSEFIIDINKEWSRALGGMLLVLVLAILINFKGRKRR
jgi:hypothetical protein